MTLLADDSGARHPGADHDRAWRRLVCPADDILTSRKSGPPAPSSRNAVRRSTSTVSRFGELGRSATQGDVEELPRGADRPRSDRVPAAAARATPTLAVVVPVLADTGALQSLLAQLRAQQPAPDEIVVVSGQQDAELAALCRAAGCTCLETGANRGAQLRAGAEAASAEVLWFLHADAELPVGATAAIADAVSSGAQAGCFRFAFQGPRGWRQALLERLVALRIFCGGIPYGDQGIFARADRYRDCGGFAPQPLFEEVRLVKRLRAGGRFEVLDRPLRVATRRWERDGWWYRSLHNRWLALRYACGAPAERLARSYRGLIGSNDEANR